MQTIPTVNPPFDTKLTSVLFELESLRSRQIDGSTPRWLFQDLKNVVHLIESLASARIEGNRTSLAGAAEDIIGDQTIAATDALQELRNIRRAVAFIEEYFQQNDGFSLGFIRELHKIVTNGLQRDGSKTPGNFRQDKVRINQSEHVPPTHLEVPSLMQELMDYLNAENERKYDILKTALAHHRFAHIHPFDNGNGRTARLLTYAMLTRQKFIDDQGTRLLNPSSIFCIDRQRYYDMLADADNGTPEELERWCLYVAEGILEEVARIGKLMNKEFAVSNLIMPALREARRNNFVSGEEFEILKVEIDKDVFQAQDVRHLFGTSPSARVQTSRVLGRMRDKKLIRNHPDFPKKYVMQFVNNDLMRGVLAQMDQNELLPIQENLDL